MPIDFNTIIQNRGAVKHFEPAHKLDELQIKELLELANRAPSAWNLQHWNFIVITDDEAREKLLPIAYGQEQIMNASVVIAVLGDLEAYRNADFVYDPIVKSGEMSMEAKSNLIEQIVMNYDRGDDVARDEAIRNASLAAMQLLLAAHAKGLDSCPMGGFDHAQFIEAFHVPQRYIPIMLIAIGKAASPARPSSRLPIDQSIVWNQFKREIANE